MKTRAFDATPRSRRRALPVAVAATAMVSLVACANRPESISASFVSHERYVHLECTDLARRMAEARAEVDKFSKLQDEKANGDAVGVFLLGIPFSKLTGDHEADVARAKGHVEAIETAQVLNKCMDGRGGSRATPDCRGGRTDAGEACTPAKEGL